MKYSNDFWLRNRAEMIYYFNQQLNEMDCDRKEYTKFYLNSLDTTNELAERISDDIKIGSEKTLLPQIASNGVSASDILTIKAYQGLYAYYKKHPEINIVKYQQRIDYELEVINSKGFADYMLIVQDYVQWCKKNDIVVGPGRGSAGGSVVLFLIGVTSNINPIEHNLMFSRFLTKDRTGYPDIDLDFDYFNRHRVIEYFEEKYGKENVSHIGAWSALGVASGIKDFAKVLGVSYVESNNLTKALSDIPIDLEKSTFKDYDDLKETAPEIYKTFEELENKYKEVFRLARKFEGCMRHLGVHASGVLITPCPISDVVPLRKDKKTGTIITLYTGVEVEELGLVKFDILGLKTLSVINMTLKSIGEDKDFEWLYKSVDMKDEEIFKMLTDKESDGIFQMESEKTFKPNLGMLKPTCFDDLVALTALLRPGPLSAGFHTMYIKRKHGNEKIEYPIRGCEEVLNSTYGIIIYQEQIMLISKIVSGFDDGQADSLTRKIVAKKKVDKMEMLRRCHLYGKINKEGPDGWENDTNAPWYDYDKLTGKPHYGNEIKGAIKNGYTEEEFMKYWNYMLGFAAYAFNKSHSASYTYITMLTAWLKVHYPVEFFAALLSVEENKEKRGKYVKVAKRFGINIKCPNISISKNNFTPSPKTREILYGLSSVAGVKAATIEIMKNAPYSSLEDAFNRIPKKSFNKTVATNLIKAGAFDSFNSNRYALLNELYDLRKEKKIEKFDVNKYDKDVCIAMEDEALSTYITYKPIHVIYEEKWEALKSGGFFGEEVTFKGIKNYIDKNNNPMLFVLLNWNGCFIEGVVFASTYASIADKEKIFKIGNKVMVRGMKDKDGKNSLICNKFLPLNNAKDNKQITYTKPVSLD
jgi:DNA polymerase-3 subunit alpha